MSFQFHKAFQTLMQEKADVLSGYRVVGGEPEVQAHVRVDYFYQMDLNRPLPGEPGEIRPLANQKPFHMVELEGLHRTLNDCRFRYHCARALLFENPGGKKSRRGQLGLTIMVVRKPVKLFGSKDYCFEKLSDWKYRTVPFRDLTVDIVLLRELQKIEGGEATALLQLLEPDAGRRPKVWHKMLEANLDERRDFKNLMMKMDKEGYMTVAEELRQEGRVEGREEGFVIGREQIIGQMILQGVDDTLIMSISKIEPKELDRLKAKFRQ